MGGTRDDERAAPSRGWLWVMRERESDGIGKQMRESRLGTTRQGQQEAVSATQSQDSQREAREAVQRERMLSGKQKVPLTPSSLTGSNA